MSRVDADSSVPVWDFTGTDKWRCHLYQEQGNPCYLGMIEVTSSSFELGEGMSFATQRRKIMGPPTRAASNTGSSILFWISKVTSQRLAGTTQTLGNRNTSNFKHSAKTSQICCLHTRVTGGWTLVSYGSNFYCSLTIPTQPPSPAQSPSPSDQDTCYCKERTTTGGCTQCRHEEKPSCKRKGAFPPPHKTTKCHAGPLAEESWIWKGGLRQGMMLSTIKYVAANQM